MKTLEHLDKYVPEPDLRFFGGFVYDGEDIELCDDRDADQDYEFAVRQQIREDVLITDLSRTYKRKNGKNVCEISHMEVELEKGQLLIYIQGLGFTVPERRMVLPKAAQGMYTLLDNRGGGECSG